MLEKKIEELEKKNKAQDEAIEALARQLLIAELRALPALKNCPNVGLVADVIIADNHYGRNAKSGALQAHHDPERRYPSGRDLNSILAEMESDPNAAMLLRPAAPKWTPPAFNPWQKETFSLTLQGEIFTNDPELAEELKAEAKRREHALRRASNS